MPKLEVIEQKMYSEALAGDYDELLASLHLVDSYAHVPDEIQRVCDSQSSIFYLGLVSNLVVGMAVLIKPVMSLGHNTAILEDLAVKRDQQCLGYGTGLIEFLIRQSLYMGADRIELHSADIREDAHKLYAKAGFKVINTRLFRKEL